MAAPRVFISSTFYDLHHVRNDIEGFLKNIGYDPIMHERGSVPYSQKETLERSCYEEVSHSDIVVSIIGGKFGTTSHDNDGSITMGELDRALNEGKILYIFIDRNVDAENKTFEANDGKIRPFHADDIRVHKYISELRRKCRNHPIETFESSLDIVEHLKRQFAGKFQQLLQIESNSSTSELAANISESTFNLTRTIDDIELRWNTIIDRLSASSFFSLGPIYYLKRLLGIHGYDVYIRDCDSLCQYLRDIGFNVDGDDLIFLGENIEGRREIRSGRCQVLTIDANVFDDKGNIKDIRKQSDLETLLTLREEDVEENDGLPF